MKNVYKQLLAIILLFGVMISCNKDDYDQPNSFSDVLFYTSQGRNLDFKIGVNNFITFSDLSQGVIDHTWFIEESSFFLKGPLTRTDSVFDDKIINRGKLETSDKTVNVLFTEGGLKTVRLRNTFPDSVALRTSTRTYPAKREGNLWVIDTILLVDVYDTIVPVIDIRKDGVSLPFMNPNDIITVEAGSTLEFIDLSTMGRPDTRKWLVAGVTKFDSVAQIQFNKLGTFSGSLRLSRTGENIPGDSDFYRIPAKFEVIPSSLPFELSGDIVELENETIQVPYNGEFVIFAGQKDFFTVLVNGIKFDIQSVSVDQIDATKINIKLVEPIYRPDVITVSYDGNGNITSSDTRSAVAFIDQPVLMHNVNLWNETVYNMEDGPNGIWKKGSGNGTVTYTTERAFEGSYSLKISTDPASPLDWTQGNGEGSSASLVAGVSYTFTWKVWIEPGFGFNGSGPWLYFDNGPDQQFFRGLPSFASGEWVEMDMVYTAPVTGTAFFGMRVRTGADGKPTTIFLDDVHVVKTEVRP